MSNSSLATMLEFVLDTVTAVDEADYDSQMETADYIRELLIAIGSGEYQAVLNENGRLVGLDVALKDTFDYKLLEHVDQGSRSLSGNASTAFILSVHLIRLFEPLRVELGFTLKYLTLVVPAWACAVWLTESDYFVSGPRHFRMEPSPLGSNNWFTVMCQAAGT